MLRRSMLLIAVTAMFTAMPLMGGPASMPSNFGTADWAVDNWRQAVRYLRYITDADVRNRLLAVPDSRDIKREAWEEFWIKYDAIESTAVNEYQREYFKRIRYANENFSTEIHREGWLTDRGQAYVKLGPPEEKETLTLQSGDRELFVWNYEQSQDATLFFLDYSGRGSVYLINPDEVAEEFEENF